MQAQSSDFVLTPFGAVVHRPTATAVIADLHLGYGAARRAAGDAVPTFDLEPLLARLRMLCSTQEVRHLVVAGDLVETGAEGHAAAVSFVNALTAQGLRLTLVPGNHDRRLQPIPGLTVATDHVQLGAWQVQHHAAANERQPTIMGHVHPVVREPRTGETIPCFLATDNRLLLPAQSPDAAGVNVLALPHWQAARCFAIVRGAVLPMGQVAHLRRKVRLRQPTYTLR